MPVRIAAPAGILLLCAWLAIAAPASAVPSATLAVGLDPKRPGAGTTISFAFRIASAAQTLPPALTHMEVRLPVGMGIDTRGLARCAAAAVRARGAAGCPANAVVGQGSVSVEVPLGEVVRTERAVLTVFAGERQGGRETLLFFAVGRVPIATRLAFTGVIVPSARGSTIQASIPVEKTLPESPDAAIVQMSATVGTNGRSYYRTRNGRRVRLHPKGATLPSRCPLGGFPFSAAFTFNDASAAGATSTVACP